MSDKKLERKLRYELAKQGYGLHKSRARNWSYYNQLGYMIYDLNTGFVVLQSFYFDLTLEDVQDFVNE